VFKPPVPQDHAAKTDREDRRVEQHRAQAGAARARAAVESELSDPFLRKGLQMLVDGGEPDAIRAHARDRARTAASTRPAAAKVFEGMGIYAPTLGIIGAVLGLMAVMQNLADPSKLGVGIAAAFTATIYGIGLANLFFLPMANKLKGLIQRRRAPARW
jgi:chemotaxis protein MotA